MKRVAVVGTGQTVYKTKRVDVNAADLIFEASRAALDDCGLEINDIDAVVFASAPEAFEGVHSPDLWCADASAALGKPMMRIHTGGSTGGAGAIAGMITGIGVTVIWRNTPVLKEALYELVPAFALAFLAVVFVSLVTHPGREEYRPPERSSVAGR